MSNLYTFHKIFTGCEEGSRGAWQEFLISYTPMMLRILDVYVPYGRGAQQRKIWQESLRELSARNFERLRTFDHQSEREFLVDLRVFVLEKTSPGLDPARDSPQAPQPTFETLGALLKGLPLIHQVVLFLKLAGYSDRTLDRLLRMTPTVAREAFDQLQANYSIVLGREQDACLWPAAWIDLLRRAWSARKAECAPLRQFVRIMDGQTGWYNKDPAEQHVAECLHCLERWTALREIVAWKREAAPLPLEESEAFLSGLPIRAERKAKRSLLKRVLGSLGPRSHASSNRH